MTRRLDVKKLVIKKQEVDSGDKVMHVEMRD